MSMMKNTVKELKPREKATILSIVNECIDNEMDKNQTIKTICAKMVKMGIVENSGCFNDMLSVALALYFMEKARHEKEKPIECLKKYAHFKHVTSKKLDDYGAFGDTIETCIRIMCKPAALVSFNDLHVKRQNAVDVTIKGVKFEIGTNGKTFLESDENEPMKGKYQKIGYGVFSDEEKEIIFTLLENGEYKKAFENIQKMVYVFEKETFFECMTTKTGRASMYQYKKSAGKWQVIYNQSKYSAFLKMVEIEGIETIGEYLKK